MFREIPVECHSHPGDSCCKPNTMPRLREADPISTQRSGNDEASRAVCPSSVQEPSAITKREIDRLNTVRWDSDLRSIPTACSEDPNSETVGTSHATLDGSTNPTALYGSTNPTALYGSTSPTALYGSTNPTALYGSTNHTALEGSTNPVWVVSAGLHTTETTENHQENRSTAANSGSALRTAATLTFPEAAVIIQGNWRRFVVRQYYEFELLVKGLMTARYLAAVEVQRHWRGYRIRSHYCLLERLPATRCLLQRLRELAAARRSAQNYSSARTRHGESLSGIEAQRPSDWTSASTSASAIASPPSAAVDTFHAVCPEPVGSSNEVAATPQHYTTSDVGMTVLLPVNSAITRTDIDSISQHSEDDDDDIDLQILTPTAVTTAPTTPLLSPDICIDERNTTKSVILRQFHDQSLRGSDPDTVPPPPSPRNKPPVASFSASMSSTEAMQKMASANGNWHSSTATRLHSSQADSVCTQDGMPTEDILPAPNSQQARATQMPNEMQRFGSHRTSVAEAASIPCDDGRRGGGPVSSPQSLRTPTSATSPNPSSSSPSQPARSPLTLFPQSDTGDPSSPQPQPPAASQKSGGTRAALPVAS